MTRLTGSLGLDYITGGGWPAGICEIWGESGSGKTTLALQAIGEIGHRGDLWMSLIGDFPRAIKERSIATDSPADAEAVFVRSMEAAGEAGLVVVDGVDHLVRKRELLGDPEYHPHPQREYAAELKALKAQCGKSGATVLFLSPPRDNLREPVRGTGISEKAVERISLYVTYTGQDGTRRVRAHSRATGRSVPLTIRLGELDNERELIHFGLLTGTVRRAGSWYVYEGVRRQGISEFARWLREHPVRADMLRNRLWRQLLTPVS